MIIIQHTTYSFIIYLNIEVGIPRVTDDELKYEKVKRRAIDFEGKPKGKSN